MANHVDGVYTRKDRAGYWISWNDAQGRRRYRRTNAQSLTQARAARAAETNRVEQAKMLGFTPPGEDSFADVAARFLPHQKARLTPKAFEREKGIIENHLTPFFTGKLAAIRRVDVQRICYRPQFGSVALQHPKRTKRPEAPAPARHGVGNHSG